MRASQCGVPVRRASAVSQLRGAAELGQSFVLRFISIKIVGLRGSRKMDVRNLFHCHYCKSFFGTEEELDFHEETFHDSDDSERESIGNNMLEDVYYSSQESDVMSVSDLNLDSDVESVSDVIDNDEDEDYFPEEDKGKSNSKVKQKKLEKSVKQKKSENSVKSKVKRKKSVKSDKSEVEAR